MYTNLSFLEHIETDDLLKRFWGWSEFRQRLNGCLHPIQDPESLESRLNRLIWDMSLYNVDSVLKKEDPQNEINKLKSSIEKAFKLLNNLYRGLNSWELRFRFIKYTNLHFTKYLNRWDNKDWNDEKEIKSFAIDKKATGHWTHNEWKIVALDVEWQKVENLPTNDIVWLADNVHLRTDSDAFFTEYLSAITEVFWRILSKLESLLNVVEYAQRAYDNKQKHEVTLHQTNQSIEYLAAGMWTFIDIIAAD